MPFDATMQDLDPNDVLPAEEMDKIRENLLYLGSPDHQIIDIGSSYVVSNTTLQDFQAATHTLTVAPSVGLVNVGFTGMLRGKGTASIFGMVWAVDGATQGQTYSAEIQTTSQYRLLTLTRPFFLSPGSYDITLKVIVISAAVDLYYPLLWAWWV